MQILVLIRKLTQITRLELEIRNNHHNLLPMLPMLLMQGSNLHTHLRITSTVDPLPQAPGVVEEDLALCLVLGSQEYRILLLQDGFLLAKGSHQVQRLGTTPSSQAAQADLKDHRAPNEDPHLVLHRVPSQVQLRNKPKHLQLYLLSQSLWLMVDDSLPMLPIHR